MCSDCGPQAGLTLDTNVPHSFLHESMGVGSQSPQKSARQRDFCSAYLLVPHWKQIWERLLCGGNTENISVWNLMGGSSGVLACTVSPLKWKYNWHPQKFVLHVLAGAKQKSWCGLFHCKIH